MNEAIRVLHVEDDSSYAELTSAFLSRETDRVSVETAADAEDGMDRLAEEQFDCIVSDYEMPGMDGIEFLEAVRSNYPDLPFILFTGKGSEEVASDAISAGATDYLQKGSTDRYTLLSNRILNGVEQYRERQRRTALERVHAIVCDVNQALVRSDSRTQTEQRVCEILADTESYRFAAFLDSTPDRETVEPRTWAGTGKQFLDAVGLRGEAGSEGGDNAKTGAFRNGEISVTQAVQSASAYEPWHDLAATHGVQSLAVIPLAYDDTSYGLLTIFADRAEAFDETEREMLAGLGDDISHAFASLDATEALNSEKERYRLLAESAMDAIVTIDADSNIRFANPAVEQVFGYAPDELVGESLTKLMPEPYRQRHRDAVKRFLRTGEKTSDWTSVELPGMRKDGERIDLSISFATFEEGDERRFEGVIRDVSERKRCDRELEQYETIAERMQDGICILNRESEFIVVNDAFTELTGYSRPELLGSHASLVRPAALDDRFDEIQAALDSGEDVEPVEMEIERADGEKLVIEGRYAPFDGDELGGRLGVWRDITVTNQREQRLEHYREYTERLFDAIDDVFFVYDREGRLQRWNTAFAEVTGYSNEELASLTAFDFIPESHHEETRAAMRDVFEVGQARLEAPVLTNDGQVIPYEFAADRVEHPDGGMRLVGVGRDISERKRREQELAESERRYRTLAENFPNGGVFLIDDDLHYQLVSGTAFDSLSMSPADLEGEEAGRSGTVSDELGALLQSTYKRALDGEQVTTEILVEGRRYDLRATPIRDENGEVTQVLAISQNITDRIEQEQQLKRQNERLNEFANIVSHDLRNPLSIADGRIELAKGECDTAHLDPAKRAIERSLALIEDLLTLAREGQQADDIEAVDLEAIAASCWRNVPTEDATLTIDTRRTIRADSSRLGQVLENLFRNSTEHSEGDPTITVGEVEGGFFVADDGPGIPADEREQVFDAGYTTTSEGTGYGLAIVKRVADAHGWDIRVTESATGGARFEITGVSVE